MQENIDVREILETGLRLSVIGHLNGSYSLAAVNRHLAMALERVKPGAVRLEHIEGEPVHDLSGVPRAERAAIARLTARPVDDEGPSVEIVQHWPLWVPPHPCDLKLVSVAWEESLVPMEMVRKINEKFDGVLVWTRFVAKALINSGVKLPVRVIGCAPDLQPYLELGERRATEPRLQPPSTEKPFVFLHVSSCFPRKGVDSLLIAYAKAFRGDQPVRLIIKGFPNPHNDIARQVKLLQTRGLRLPDIVIINRDVPLAELLQLYWDADAMVLPNCVARGSTYLLRKR